MDESDIQHALTQAVQARQAGRHDEEARLYRDILTRAGEQPIALNALGMGALRRGDPGTAASLFDRAIAADPKAPELWMNLARARREQGDGRGEEAALGGALAIDRRHFMALVRRAELFDRRGDDRTALACWSDVLAMEALVDQRTPALNAIFDHARRVAERGRAKFTATVEEMLAPARQGLDVGARRRIDACIDHALGRRRIFVNECAGLHVPFLPADEFFERGHFPWLTVIEAQTSAIRSECEALLGRDEVFAPYVAMPSGTPENQWSPLDGKPDWSALHLWKDGVRDDAACALCPITTAAVESLPLCDLPGRTPTVFFSVLRPGTRLPPHTGVSNARAIIHLPLIVPPDCGFRVGGETRQWREGEAFAFDDTIEHEAWNQSDQPRAILIFDVWNPHIVAVERDLLRTFVLAADGRDDPPDRVRRTTGG